MEVRLFIFIGLLVLGTTGFFLLVRRRWGGWWAGAISPFMGIGFLVFADGALETITSRDYWGPKSRERFASTSERTQAVDGAVVSIADWDGDGAPEQARSVFSCESHFHGNTTYSRIEVLRGADGRILGTIDFRVPLAAVPRAIGDRDGDGIEEFAVDYLGTTYVWGRESFL